MSNELKKSYSRISEATLHDIIAPTGITPQELDLVDKIRKAEGFEVLSVSAQQDFNTAIVVLQSPILVRAYTLPDNWSLESIKELLKPPLGEYLAETQRGWGFIQHAVPTADPGCTYILAVNRSIVQRLRTPQGKELLLEVYPKENYVVILEKDGKCVPDTIVDEVSVALAKEPAPWFSIETLQRDSQTILDLSCQPQYLGGNRSFEHVKGRLDHVLEQRGVKYTLHRAGTRL